MEVIGPTARNEFQIRILRTHKKHISKNNKIKDIFRYSHRYDRILPKFASSSLVSSRNDTTFFISSCTHTISKHTCTCWPNRFRVGARSNAARINGEIRREIEWKMWKMVCFGQFSSAWEYNIAYLYSRIGIQEVGFPSWRNKAPCISWLHASWMANSFPKNWIAENNLINNFISPFIKS